MPATYVHLSGRNVDDALLRLHGLKQENEEEHLVCPRCKMNNDTISRYCYKCGLPLGVDIALQDEQQKTKYNKLMSELMDNPEVRAVIEHVLLKLPPES